MNNFFDDCFECENIKKEYKNLQENFMILNSNQEHIKRQNTT
jgi:hypothetical protein